MHDELRPGVDQPRRGQYVVLVLIITLLAVIGYFYRRNGSPTALDVRALQGGAGFTGEKPHTRALRQS